MEVVKIKSGDSFAIINRADFREEEHELFKGESLSKPSAAQALADEIETRRQLEANRGQVGSAAMEESPRNTSGTFSTPTPTDIRYPNKNETEFENNHGALIGKAAPDVRSEHGLPDAPGGINPDAETEKREAGEGADAAAVVTEPVGAVTEHNPDVPEPKTRAAAKKA